MTMRTISLFALAMMVTAAVGCSESNETADSVPPPSPGSTVQGSNEGSVWRSNWSGGAASTFLSDHHLYGHVNAYEDKAGKVRKASLNVYMQYLDDTSYQCFESQQCYCAGTDCTPETQRCETYQSCYHSRYTTTYGWGEIPASDFLVNDKAAHLSTDLSKVPGFQYWSCETTCVGAPAVCSDVCTSTPPSGQFEMVWQSDGLRGGSSTGTTTERNGVYATRTNGSWSWATAGVKGRVLGVDVGGGSTTYGLNATLSRSQSASVSKDIIKPQ